MPLPPAWKIRREAWRIREQVRSFLAPLVEVPRQRFYDRFVFPKLPIKRGELPVGDKIALVILYQPKGLAASTIFTFDHLVSKGWTPVAVSNAPLSHEDEKALSTRCAHIVTRPNIGYDFGAYRDGIKVLHGLGLEPEKFILMNDSTWFPLREDDDSLDQMEALQVDLAGHILKIEDHRSRGQDHVESHLLMFSRKFLTSIEFNRFWSNYVFSDIRQVTIERGERGLGNTAFQGGFSVDALLKIETIIELFRGMSDDELISALRATIPSSRRARTELNAFLMRVEDDRCWRTDFEKWVQRELRHSISFAFVHPLFLNGLTRFAKKSREQCFHDVRQRILRLNACDGIAPLHPDVLAEMELAVSNWTPPYNWRERPEDTMTEEERIIGP